MRRVQAWLEHASPAQDWDAQLKESLLANEVYARHSQLRSQLVGEDFEMPPAGMFRWRIESPSEINFYIYGLGCICLARSCRLPTTRM